MNTGSCPTAVPGYDTNEWVIRDPGSDEFAEEFDEALELSYAGRHQESMRRLVAVLSKLSWHIDALHHLALAYGAQGREAEYRAGADTSAGPDARRSDATRPRPPANRHVLARRKWDSSMYFDPPIAKRTDPHAGNLTVRRYASEHSQSTDHARGQGDRAAWSLCRRHRGARDLASARGGRARPPLQRFPGRRRRHPSSSVRPSTGH